VLFDEDFFDEDLSNKDPRSYNCGGPKPQKS